MHDKLYIPANSAAGPYTVDITPESAGWAESSLHVVDLDTAESITRSTGDTEVMILPLAGGGTVQCGDLAEKRSAPAFRRRQQMRP